MFAIGSDPDNEPPGAGDDVLDELELSAEALADVIGGLAVPWIHDLE